uniref:ATP synthase F0 subunit 8 n=1 Tax=Cryptotympana atrata TaxID=678702 RepID=A0A344ALE0_9HEMI|nr:ATP synthase F0 subunit 8 [Cryptotympana atrata]AFY16770.1 ATP synthase F0 subunit 8 [Cryptotympana atrata]AWV83188.1 ATP synthase F0 subunit 8 [Cryptotympana atrata]QUV77443.1 ATP synthase F0 subunit 8 [Cryptotympana atrata]
MPQMSPMYWLMLMFYFIIMFILMIMYVYFMMMMKPNFFMEKMNLSKIDWSW